MAKSLATGLRILCAPCQVVRYHSLMVDPATLPPHLVPTAWTVPGAQPSSNVQPPAGSTSAAEILHNSDLHMKTTIGAAKQPTVSTNGAQKGANSSAQSQQQGEMGLAPVPRTPVSFETKSGPANSNGRNEAAEVAVPGDSVLMGISHRSLPHHGVQFHPESIATAYGERLLRNFYEMTVAYWEGPHVEGKAGEGNGGSQLVNGQHAQRFRSLSESYRLGADWLASAAAAGVTAPQARSRECLERDAQSTASKEWAVPGASVLQDGEGVGQTSMLPEAASPSSPPPEEVPGRFRVVWKKLPGVVREGSGAEQLFMALYGQAGGEDAFWLDSSSTAAVRGDAKLAGLPRFVRKVEMAVRTEMSFQAAVARVCEPALFSCCRMLARIRGIIMRATSR
jgi:anthranilate/para-aminobenzoate synthase component II